jgi:hypothetical protein
MEIGMVDGLTGLLWRFYNAEERAIQIAVRNCRMNVVVPAGCRTVPEA